MKRKMARRLLAVAFFSVAALAGGAQQHELAPKVVPVKPHAVFDRMKTLAGEWEGTTSRGLAARVTYRLTSGGTVLHETLLSKDFDGKDLEMITAYYLNGDTIMMTHFCAGNTQPRMVAAAGNGAEIVFKTVDVTNLPGKQYGHMGGMKLRMVDANHMTQAWSWREDGKEQTPEVFTFERRK